MTDYPDPPRTDWGDLALLSEATDPEDYRDISGRVLDEENFQRLQEMVSVPGTLEDRPASAPFDGAKYEALDVNTVFRWDAAASEWTPLNSGTASQPVPGVAHLETIHTRYASVSGWKELDVVELGADPTGTDDSSSAILDNLEDGVKFVFPDGDYVFETDITFDRTDATEIAFEARGEVSISFQNMSNRGSWINSNSSTPPDRLEISGFDFSTGGRHRFATARANDYLRVENCRVTGQYDQEATGTIRVDVMDPDGVGYVDNYNALDGSIDMDLSLTTPQGILVSSDHVGEVFITGCHIEGFRGNGLYGASLTGKIHVRGGIFRNNGVSQVRFQSDGCSVKGTHIEQTSGATHDGRGVRLRNGEGQLVENVTFNYSNPDSNLRMLQVTTEAGSATIDSCKFDVTGHGHRIFDIVSHDGSQDNSKVTLTGNTFSGTSEAATSQLVNIGRPVAMVGDDWDVTTAKSDPSRVIAGASDGYYSGISATTDIQFFRSFSASSGNRFVGNYLTATNGDEEIQVSGTDSTAVGNVTGNGMAGLTETAANIDKSA